MSNRQPYQFAVERAELRILRQNHETHAIKSASP